VKIREIFCENPRIIVVLFYDVHKENMFTIYLEDGRKAPSKAIFHYTKKTFLMKKKTKIRQFINMSPLIFIGKVVLML